MTADIHDRFATALACPDDPVRQCLGRPGFTLVRERLDAVLATRRNHIGPLPEGVRVAFGAHSGGNLIVCGEVDIARFAISITGTGNVVYIGGGHKLGGRLVIVGDDNLFYMGEGATCNQAHMVLRSQRRSIILGDDCMLSFHVALRNCDMHGIFDLDSLEVINGPQSVLVHPHVWIGEHAHLLKGAEVGAGSIVGTHAVVTGALPARVVAVGTPARVLRENVSWTRSPQPSLALRQEMARAVREGHAGPVDADEGDED